MELLVLHQDTTLEVNAQECASPSKNDTAKIGFPSMFAKIWICHLIAVVIALAAVAVVIVIDR